MNLLITFFLLFLAVLPIGVMKNATFIVSLVKGAMFGALYNKDEFEDVNEYTIQFCFVFVTITILWETPAE